MQNAARRPGWWSTTHDTAWQRTKDALRRDWEQTQNDITGGGHDLNQDAGDTFRQARGRQNIPAGNVPNIPDANDIERHAKAAEKEAKKEAKKESKEAKKEARRWEKAEDAVQYGYGSGLYRTGDWNASETDLRKEWSSLDRDRSWEDARDDIEYGWRGARTQPL
jgi:hypothetical protein